MKFNKGDIVYDRLNGYGKGEVIDIGTLDEMYPIKVVFSDLVTYVTYTSEGKDRDGDYALSKSSYCSNVLKDSKLLHANDFTNYIGFYGIFTNEYVEIDSEYIQEIRIGKLVNYHDTKFYSFESSNNRYYQKFIPFPSELNEQVTELVNEIE